ncbi:MAG: protein jag [Spirochaetaceae bacterium]|jgi:spoIIIJ-associated protein|nr:protein jag [Spirochaetaceae bacterium]
MVYQFEGKTEKEAIANAARELGLEKDKFDIEIIESQKGSLFRKGLVRIEVHADEVVREKSGNEAPVSADLSTDRSTEPATQTKNTLISEEEPLPAENDFEKALIDYVIGIIERMGYDADVGVQFRENNKIGLKIASHYSAVIIGKKGKTLDALQLIANIYAGRIGNPEIHVVLDSENYRLRREETIVRMAYDAADRVRSNRASLLLEPMNPFERRIVHTTLSNSDDVATRSEGEGMYKQVRVSYHREK